MKSASLLCLASVALIGCTTTTETTTTTRNAARGRTSIYEPYGDRASNKRTYTREDIEQTGRENNVADALQTLDPSITARGNGR